MIAAALTPFDEEIIAGGIAFVRFGTTRGEFCLVESIGSRGTVMVRPVHPTEERWDKARQVSRQDFDEMLTPKRIEHLRRRGCIPAEVRG